PEPQPEEQFPPEPQPEEQFPPEPQPEEQFPLEPQPEEQFPPEPQPEEQFPPEPQPEEQFPPEPQPEEQFSLEPQPEEQFSLEPQPEEQFSLEPQPEEQFSLEPQPEEQFSLEPQPEEQFSLEPQPEESEEPQPEESEEPQPEESEEPQPEESEEPQPEESEEPQPEESEEPQPEEPEEPQPEEPEEPQPVVHNLLDDENLLDFGHTKELTQQPDQPEVHYELRDEQPEVNHELRDEQPEVHYELRDEQPEVHQETEQGQQEQHKQVSEEVLHEQQQPAELRRRDAEGRPSTLDRIINSPSTEFDSLDPDLAGLTDYREEALYPEADLAAGYLADLGCSAAGTPLPPRTAGLAGAAHAEGDEEEEDDEEEEEVDEEESRDSLTALPSPPPPPPPLEATPLPLLGTRRPEGRVSTSASHQPATDQARMNSSAAAVEAAVAEEVLVDNGPDTDVNADIDASEPPEESDEPLRLSQPAPPSPLPPLPSPLPTQQVAAAELAPTEELEADPAPEPTEATDPPVPALEDGPPLVELSGPDCPVRSVIVYLDKAEVSRQLKLRSRAGETEVVVRDLTAAIDGDSVRVELLGAATITDVVFSAAPSQSDEARRDADKLAATAELDRERRAAANAAGKLDRAMKQREVLATYADALAKQPMPAECSGPYDPKRVATLTGFFDLYEAQAARLDEDAAEAREALTRHQEAAAALETRLNEIEAQFNELKRREIRIYVESRQAADIELQLTYIVTRAKWTPRYDIRVRSNESVLQIVYHGVVQQQTGEPWLGCRVSLSTSRPGVGGSAPPAAAHRAQFARSSGRGSAAHRQQLSGKKFTGGGKQQQQQQQQPETIPESVNSTAGVGDEAAAAPIETQPVQSTKLDAPHLVSIPSDDGWHKVTVASIDLTPVFEYECVPQRSPYAYLKATVTNSSSYALLPGQANIFVDGCFVGKSELKAAAPLEEFQCQLGADRGIQVAYRPVFRKRENAQSKVATVSHRQSIALRNCHARPVRMLLMEPLPVAGEDKIKVNLLEPAVKHPEKYDRQKPVRINRSNCVEWEFELGPDETRELVIRYNIDLPPGESLDYTVCDA
ncbi:hypothetical protein BOX15_Mlig001997g1, partial [Macrostomum lignano]